MSSGGAGSGGIISSLTGNRPSTSTQPVPSSSGVSGGGQWGAPNGGAAPAAAGTNSAALGSAANSNSLSYGSLKNRFLSGTTKNTAPVPAPSGSNAGNQNTAAASANSGKSKLFSLAR